MNIIIFNITLDWVYRLYNDYLLNIIKYLKEKDKNITIKNEFYDRNLYIKKNFIKNKINDLLYFDKIILSGDLSIINEIIHLIGNKYFNKLYFLNFEQMSKESYYKYLRIIPKEINIIDYSEENIPYFQKIYKNIYLLPPIFQYNHNNLNKDIDLLSLKNNKYREDILNNLKLNGNYNKLYINNIYNEERDNLYKKSKIYLNIHSSKDHKTMELIRIINLLCNKVIVLSQKSICDELLFIKKYIIICNEDNLLNDYLNSILNNYSYFYNKLFVNEDCFDFEKYKEYFNENFKLFTES